MHAFLNIAVRAARSAGKVLLRSMDNLEQIHRSSKGRNDFVSDADRGAEQVIIDTIRQVYPDHAILAEESGLLGDESAPATWIVDPLDGTTNFLHGVPHFAISIGVKIKGRIEHGVVYDPLQDELFTASRGAGAQLNNRRLRVATQKSLDNCLLATGFPFRDHRKLPQWQAIFSALFEHCGDMRRAGSAALDLAYVASGRLDGFWEFGLNCWDLAAGTLLVREAGGIVDDLSGTGNYLETGNILCANPKVFKAMYQKIQPLLTH